MAFTINIPIGFASADALQRALYRIADEGTWDVTNDDTNWAVTLVPKEDVDIAELEADFKKHVVDYGLREKIRNETEQVRSLLLAHAFSAVTH